MIYALDTNTISFMLKDNDNVYNRYFDVLSKGNRCIIPLMVYYEVRRGLKANDAQLKMRSFEKICFDLGIVEITIADMNTAADIYADLKNRGRMIDDGDLLIAAQVVARGYTLVTNNRKHFENVKGLTFEDWCE
ncbi:MAG: PIN domain-containing protein [Oscillospiraceae bacterium]|nr:PIN domain-containing protein [Oscillospiraceae bacterium]